MAKVARVRVELKLNNPRATKEERERAFRAMHSAFRKKVTEAGIISKYKEKQFFESKSEKKRRRSKKAELERKKQKLRQYFG